MSDIQSWTQCRYPPSTEKWHKLICHLNEMPLDLRRRMLSWEYCLSVISSNAYNPARTSQFTKFLDKNPNNIRPLGLRVSGDLFDIGFTQKNILITSVSSTLPWHLVSPTVDLFLSTVSKSVTSLEIFLSKFLEIRKGLQEHYHTDGSKMNNIIATACCS